MSDLISRKAAINMCRKPCMRNADCSDFEMEIMMLPPIQPEIVRCEECLYIKICSWEKQGAKFCSFAEKREVTT